VAVQGEKGPAASEDRLMARFCENHASSPFVRSPILRRGPESFAESRRCCESEAPGNNTRSRPATKINWPQALFSDC
jgi:hypothetical protein